MGTVFMNCRNGLVISSEYKGRSVSSRTNNPNSTTGNPTILTVMLLFNIVSLQFNTAFPSVYKSAEACTIEVFVDCS